VKDSDEVIFVVTNEMLFE